jgi:hypothetical protein
MCSAGPIHAVSTALLAYKKAGKGVDISAPLLHNTTSETVKLFKEQTNGTAIRRSLDGYGYRPTDK